MRWLLAIPLLAACAAPSTRSDHQALSQVDLCELGQQLYDDALDELVTDSKPCTSDDQCVGIATDVDCNGFSVSLCGTVVQRDSVWDPEQVCAELDAYPPSEFTCSTQARCIKLVPACEQGRCVDRSVTR